MPFDGIFLSGVCGELSAAVGARVEKIKQPSGNEIVLSLKAVGFSKRLLISACPGMARIHFTNGQYENPPAAPLFCMLLRKWLAGAKLLSVLQTGYERVVTLTFSSVTELGDRCEVRLVCEFAGSRPNIILLAENGRIIDSLRRTELDSARLIQPGAVYEPPTLLKKESLFSQNAAQRVAESFYPLGKAVLDSIEGLSPLAAREIAFIADADDTAANETPVYKIEAALESAVHHIKGGKPYVLYDGAENPKDFCFMPITQYGVSYVNKEADGFCSLLDDFYLERDKKERLRSLGAGLYKTLCAILSRTDKKIAVRIAEKERCAGREKYRIFGELIKANISLIEKGADFAVVPNYYDENISNIKIPLTPSLTPAENAAKYFNEYRKLCSAEQLLDGLIADGKAEREYILSVMDLLSRTESAGEIEEIREELISGGFIKRQNKKGAKIPQSQPREYLSSDGYKILVGRNNVQNDRLTLKIAARDDLWFHTKSVHGSHVIILCNKTVPPDTTLLEAACLAAYHSQARESENVAVDYTNVFNVKKPSGAKAGMVIYKNNKTLYVTPKEP